VDEGERRGRQSHRATIKDVARESGVSLATVSNVVNGTKNVRAETRRAVEEAIERLGYRPNPIARSLIARRGRLADPAGENTLPRLISVGYVSIDYVAPLQGPPRDGERLTSQAIEKMLGGPASNVAVMAAGLGPPFGVNVELITQVGDDADSDWALGELASRGVDTAGAVRVRGSRLSRCIVLVTTGGARTIVNEPLSIARAEILDYLARADKPARRSCIHVEGFQVYALRGVLPKLRTRGFLLSTHATGLAGSWRTPDGLRRIRQMFDVSFLDREVATAIAGGDASTGAGSLVETIDAAVQTHGHGVTVLTLASAGAVLLRPGCAPLQVEPPRVEAVVDTTGAGDAFAGIFLASWLTDEDPEAALRRATHGAALSITALGALGKVVRAADLPADLRAQTANAAIT